MSEWKSEANGIVSNYYQQIEPLATGHYVYMNGWTIRNRELHAASTSIWPRLAWRLNIEWSLRGRPSAVGWRWSFSVRRWRGFLVWSVPRRRRFCWTRSWKRTRSNWYFQYKTLGRCCNRSSNPLFLCTSISVAILYLKNLTCMHWL